MTGKQCLRSRNADWHRIAFCQITSEIVFDEKFIRSDMIGGRSLELSSKHMRAIDASQHCPPMFVKKLRPPLNRQA
jgi:hypothetical protein